MSELWIKTRRMGGAVLVLLQFGLLVWLAVMAAPQVMQHAMMLPGWGLLGLSVGLAGWTLWHNRLGNFNVHPEPKTNGQLVTTGPYRLIRHPMYTAVLLLAAGLACAAGQLWAWLAWVALLAVLLAKAMLEERWLRECHPQYASYCQRSKRFIPWLY
jgi:protein-S-isoprenylcysteine O-methyltransferase Ste14